MSLKRWWVMMSGGLLPALAVKVLRLAAGPYTGSVNATSAVTVRVEPTGTDAEFTSGSSFTLDFPAAGSYLLRFYTTAQSALTRVDLSGAGVTGTEGSPDGVADFSDPGLSALAYIDLTGGAVNTVRGYVSDGFYMRSTRLAVASALDISGISAARIFIDSGKWSTIAWPADKSRISHINANSHRMAGTVTVSGFPVMKTLFAQQDAFTGSKMTALDVRNNPVLDALDAGNGSLSQILYTAATWPLLKSLSARISNFRGQGAHLAQVIGEGTGLTLFNFKDANLLEAEMKQVLQAVQATPTGRPTTAKQIQLEGASTATSNEALVQQATRDVITSLSGSAWTVSFNRPILQLARTDANTIRLTYAGSENITIWNVGDTIRLSASSNTAGLATGDYVVSAGSGKVWYISQSGATINASATGTFDRI